MLLSNYYLNLIKGISENPYFVTIRRYPQKTFPYILIKTFSVLFHWFQLTANLILLGSFVFLAMVDQRKPLSSAYWTVKLEKSFPWLVMVMLVSMLGILSTTTGEATGIVSNVWSPGAWLKLVMQTWVGHIWLVVLMLVFLLMGTILSIQKIPRTRWHYVLCALVASLPLIAGSLLSHSGAEDISVGSIAPYALHILLAGIWFGALPAFIFILVDGCSQFEKISHLEVAIHLRKFSTFALPVMLLLMVTGLVVADRMVDGYYHTLVSSSYGWLLSIKLVLLAVILSIAYQARHRWLPLFSQAQDTKQTIQAALHLRKWVTIELALALILLLVATMLANTLPAKHAIITNWPFPFRFVFDTNWDEPDVQEKFWFGAALLAVALIVFGVSIKENWRRRTRILVPSGLVVTALVIALPPFAIEAYPTTYQKPLIPLDTISISNGSQLFAEHCASCHGPQGKGNGIRAGTLTSLPADLLTEPHTAKHTVGNFFHWISHGIPGTDMPGYAALLSEEARWDIVNYLHALSRGFDARLLGSMILPEKPAVAAPVFSYSTHAGSVKSIKDFRFQKNVLLVLFSWPHSQQRLNQLVAAYQEIGMTLNTEILVVPMNESDAQQFIHASAAIPFSLLTDGWQEIKNTYLLYRRVRTVPDLLGQGIIPGHMEFLIDRFGYMRARWVGQFEGFGWSNISALTLQISMLNQEDEIMPPPGDHAH